MVRAIDANAMIANLEAMRDQLGYTAISLDGMIKGLREAPTVNLSIADGVLMPSREAPEPEPEAPPGPTEAEEKRAILQRLKDYRAANGLGALEAVSAKTAHQKGKRLPADTLRYLCADGAPKLPMSDWHKISRALDALEQNNRKEEESCQ